MFSESDNNFIDFGRFTVYQSLKEMKIDGDDLNYVDYDKLSEDTMRNISNQELLDIIEKVLGERIKGADMVKDWREGGQ